MVDRADRSSTASGLLSSMEQLDGAIAVAAGTPVRRPACEAGFRHALHLAENIRERATGMLPLNMRLTTREQTFDDISRFDPAAPPLNRATPYGLMGGAGSVGACVHVLTRLDHAEAEIRLGLADTLEHADPARPAEALAQYEAVIDASDRGPGPRDDSLALALLGRVRLTPDESAFHPGEIRLAGLMATRDRTIAEASLAGALGTTDRARQAEHLHDALFHAESDRQAASAHLGLGRLDADNPRRHLELAVRSPDARTRRRAREALTTQTVRHSHLLSRSTPRHSLAAAKPLWLRVALEQAQPPSDPREAKEIAAREAAASNLSGRRSKVAEALTVAQAKGGPAVAACDAALRLTHDPDAKAVAHMVRARHLRANAGNLLREALRRAEDPDLRHTIAIETTGRELADTAGTAREAEARHLAALRGGKTESPGDALARQLAMLLDDAASRSLAPTVLARGHHRLGTATGARASLVRAYTLSDDPVLRRDVLMRLGRDVAAAAKAERARAEEPIEPREDGNWKASVEYAEIVKRRKAHGKHSDRLFVRATRLFDRAFAQCPADDWAGKVHARLAKGGIRPDDTRPLREAQELADRSGDRELRAEAMLARAEAGLAHVLPAVENSLRLVFDPRQPQEPVGLAYLEAHEVAETPKVKNNIKLKAADWMRRYPDAAGTVAKTLGDPRAIYEKLIEWTQTLKAEDRYDPRLEDEVRFPAMLGLAALTGGARGSELAASVATECEDLELADRARTLRDDLRARARPIARLRRSFADLGARLQTDRDREPAPEQRARDAYAQPAAGRMARLKKSIDNLRSPT